MTGLTIDEIAVKQAQSLGRNACDLPAGCRSSCVAEVKHLEHGHKHRTLDEGIDRAAGSLLFIEWLPDLVRIAVSLQSSFRHEWIHARSVHLRIELAAHSQSGIPNGFNLQPARRDAPEEPILWILGSVLWIPTFSHAVCVASDDQTMEFFERPAFTHKPA